MIGSRAQEERRERLSREGFVQKIAQDMFARRCTMDPRKVGDEKVMLDRVFEDAEAFVARCYERVEAIEGTKL